MSPARSGRRKCRLPQHVLGLLVVAVVALSGCVSDGNRGERPAVPDQSVLEPATQALDKAVRANAEDFAPRAVDSARRRITLARDILFAAARADRDLKPAERERIDVLVAQARLDAREALVETQAKAVNKQLGQLQQTQSQPADETTGRTDGSLGFGNGMGGSGLSNTALIGG